MKYPNDFINKIICGDCLEVMKTMPDDCIDTVITDPPYGIGFMGKEWDNFDGNYIRKGLKSTKYNEPVKKGLDKRITKKRGSMAELAGLYDQSIEAHIKFQEWVRLWATEALRVAKPGSTLLCFGGTRTYHRLACAIEDAGWILKDCIMWLYGSGFPKASDISQTLDKNECRKQLEKKLDRKPTQKEFKKAWNNFRKVIRTKQHQYPDSPHLGTYKKVNISSDGIFQSENKNTNLSAIPITTPATPEAKLWNGWKSHGLKPAYEPIIVAMNPNEGSYANNALKWGVAGLNIDGGRIKSEVLKSERRTSKTGYGIWNKGTKRAKKKGEERHNPEGRYPANVILDAEAGRLLDEQSGVSKSIASPVNNEPTNADSKIYGWAKYPKMHKSGAHFGDTGGASRFFYCAKASKSERNKGCGDIDIPEYRWNNSGICQQIKGRKGNHHPTVKPLALMKYLCTLTKTPTGGIVLDPFCGSGTTLMACKELKRDYIGIDNNPEYCEIAKRRVNAIPESLF